MNIFSVDTIAVTIGDYPLSYLELVGTALYFASVGLIARKNLLTWPVGIVSVVLYGLLFWQIQLYSDCLEQLYYRVISVWGWLTWKATKDREKDLPTGFSSVPVLALWAGIIALGTVSLGSVTSNLNVWLPAWFPEPASYPWLDAFTTVASFAAMYLLTKRRAESWAWWIVVDVLGVGLYWVKDVRFIALQYAVLTGIAAYGLWVWSRKTPRETPIHQ